MAHAAYKKAIVESGDSGTIVTRRGTIPVQSLRSRFIEDLAAMEQSGAGTGRIEEFIGRDRARKAQIAGDIENGDAYAGSSAGLIREIIPAAAVIQKMIQEYKEAVRRMDFSSNREPL